MKFDFIIVGAGSAGCVLATRLTDNKQFNVLLIEAGSEISSDITNTIPLGVGRLLNNKNNLWSDNSIPSIPNFLRSVDWVSGKCLGGSSAINGMVFVRGHPLRFDEWANAGCSDWSYQNCLPYFKKLEDCRFNDSRLRHVGGPISAEFAEKDEISERFINACIENGYPKVFDYNADIPDGVGYLQLSSKRGRRISAAKGYLNPIVNRENLTILKNTQVTRILFDDKKRAIGVILNKDGQLNKAFATKEVILCAGTIRSPKLLELSGVGNPEILGQYEIPLVHPNLAVGENLQDHLMARICYQTTVKNTVNNILGSKILLTKELIKYFLFGKGILATTTLKSTAYIRSNALEPIPNLRVQVSLMSAEARIPGSSNGSFDLSAIRSSLDPGSAFHIG
ncbi:MAG: GMC family oxidoreductase N-terminal domain-containing protein, partial [Polynucleobacter sp.]|nr:GMC family oxidoreductase N-terminal domain-containing protein [Polynucleobacter sp.]